MLASENKTTLDKFIPYNYTEKPNPFASNKMRIKLDPKTFPEQGGVALKIAFAIFCTFCAFAIAVLCW